MGNLQASIKDSRQNIKRASSNLRLRKRYKKAIKIYNSAIDSGDSAKASTLLPNLTKVLDKAAKKGVLKSGNVSRKKSRLAKKLNKLTAPDVKNTPETA